MAKLKRQGEWMGQGGMFGWVLKQLCRYLNREESMKHTEIMQNLEGANVCQIWRAICKVYHKYTCFDSTHTHQFQPQALISYEKY